MNTAATTAEAEFGGAPNSDDLEKAARCHEDLQEIGAEPEVGVPPNPGTESGEFGGDTKSDEELKAIELSIVLERTVNERDRLGREFGEAMVALRDKLKPEKGWMEYLEWLGINYDLANKWINKVEGNETRHGKKAAKPKQADADPSKAEQSKSVTSWEKLTIELNALTGYAHILKKSQPVSESFVTQLNRLADDMGFKIEPRGSNE